MPKMLSMLLRWIIKRTVQNICTYLQTPFLHTQLAALLFEHPSYCLIKIDCEKSQYRTLLRS